MKWATTLAAVGLAVLILAPVARADWDEGDLYKWLQRPDLTPDDGATEGTGMDVYATYPKVLADDFLCTSTDPITDIHIWGSWRDDSRGTCVPDKLGFWVGIFSDVPADENHYVGGNNTNNGVHLYSRPGTLLWSQEFSWGGSGAPVLNTFQEQLVNVVTDEAWYNPNDEEYDPDNHDGVYQYNFWIDPADAFVQEGTPQEEIVYWLAVSAKPAVDPCGDMYFGWKTTLPEDQWNDDAVFGHFSPNAGAGALLNDWVDMHYPAGHPLEGQTLDLAFVITPEPATLTLMGLGTAGALLARRRRKA